MIPVWSAVAAGICGAAVASLYWHRRLRTVEQSLETSAMWDEKIVPEATGSGTAGGEEASLLNQAASAADVPPENLPERIGERTEKIRDLKSRIESMRDGWVESYWRALEQDTETETPRVVTVDLHGGIHDDARAFAIHALETEDEVVLAVGRADATFAVGVNESMTEQFGIRADEIADTVATEAGGGGGGMESLATGGGEDVDSLLTAVEACQASVRERLHGEADAIETTGSHTGSTGN